LVVRATWYNYNGTTDLRTPPQDVSPRFFRSRPIWILAWKYPRRSSLGVLEYLSAMPQLQPTGHQQHAIEARLNYFLGADEYDRLFAGFKVSHVHGHVLTVCVRPECADDVQAKYSWHIAIVAESILRSAVHKVSVVPLDECTATHAS
jgi:hypothetical protein